MVQTVQGDGGISASAISWKWLAITVVGIVGVGGGSWLTYTSGRMVAIEGLLTDVRLEVRGLRGDLTSIAEHGSRRHERMLMVHERRLDELEKHE